MTGNQQVIDLGSGEDGSKDKTGGNLHGKVFEAVDGKIDLAAQESLFELLREESRALSSRLMERQGCPGVAGSGDDLQLDE